MHVWITLIWGRPHRSIELTDEIKEVIRRVLKASREPLETKEIQEMVSAKEGRELTRSKLVYRLNNLRGEGEIRGKSVGSGKGVWIWWSESHGAKD